MAKTKAKTKADVRTCAKDGCTKRMYGRRKWCATHKEEIRREQNKKAAKKYAKKWGNQRLTTKQTAAVKLDIGGPVTVPASVQTPSPEPEQGNVVVVSGTPVEVLT